MLKKIASLAMVFALTATLLWGGCLSCSQYFMLPSVVPQDCCAPAGGCKKPVTESEAQDECRIQPMALNAEPGHLAPPAFSTLPAHRAATFAPIAFRLNAFHIKPPFPPDICLLHSTLLI